MECQCRISPKETRCYNDSSTQRLSELWAIYVIRHGTGSILLRIHFLTRCNETVQKSNAEGNCMYTVNSTVSWIFLWDPTISVFSAVYLAGALYVTQHTVIASLHMSASMLLKVHLSFTCVLPLDLPNHSLSFTVRSTFWDQSKTAHATVLEYMLSE